MPGISESLAHYPIYRDYHNEQQSRYFRSGGALKGIGEKFSPDLFTGTGNFTVPIALPPGRNGFQPELNLVYSTWNGNGPFGLGWNLSIPGICRKTSQGLPRFRDDADDLEKRDTFILSAAEDLVPVETSDTWTRYRPRTEGLFALITHHKDAGNDYWEVRSKDGLISLYGTPMTLNANADWEDPFFPLEGQDFPARSLANPELELADLFGNGLPDILEMNNTVRYWRNLGNGQFDLPRTITSRPRIQPSTLATCRDLVHYLSAPDTAARSNSRRGGEGA